MSSCDCTQEYKGTVENHGRIPLSDFYYQGGHNDADTFILHIDTIKFKKDEDSEWKSYNNIFDGAYVEYNNKKNYVVKNKLIKIRLRGIDEPELHFPFDVDNITIELNEDQKLASYTQ